MLHSCWSIDNLIMWMLVYLFVLGFALSADAQFSIQKEEKRQPSSGSKTEIQEISAVNRSDLQEPVTQGNPEKTLAPSSNTTQQCAFLPEMNGSWRSTLWGDVKINKTSIVLNRHLAGNENLTSLTCLQNSDSGDYILRTKTAKNGYGADYSYYTCIRLEQINADQVHVVVRTARNDQANSEPLMAVSEKRVQKETDLFNMLCNSVKATEGVLIKQGREDKGAAGCPENLQGLFDLVYTDSFGKNGCKKNGVLTSCTKNKTLVHEYTTCSQDTGQKRIQGTDEYVCVEGAPDRILLFENKLSTFSCLNITQQANLQLVSYRRSSCFDSWWSNINLDDDLEEFALTKRETCSKKSESTGKTSENTKPRLPKLHNVTVNNKEEQRYFSSYGTTTYSEEIKEGNRTRPRNSANKRQDPSSSTVFSSVTSVLMAIVLTLPMSSTTWLN